MSETPVYVFTGFLGGGKTTFIQRTLEDKRFCNGVSTLLLLCEDGEEELDTSKFAKPDSIHIEMIDSHDDMTIDLLANLQKKYKAKRVLLEYNGMWLFNDFLEAMPDGWLIYQEVSMADAADYPVYNANMRNLVGDKLANCDMVVFHNMKPETSKEELHKIVRSITKRCNIIFDYGDHAEQDDIVDPLPFDVNADVIEIANDDFGIWYGDLNEHADTYVGKTVKFLGLVAKQGRLPPNSFVIGRHIMTCCAADVQYGGLACKWTGVNALNHLDWVIVTARIFWEKSKIYGNEEGPVLSIIKCEKSEKPDPEVVTFG